MTVFFHIPAAPLNTYIKCMWYCDAAPRFRRLKILPVPSLHLMINFGELYHVYEPNSSLPFTSCTESWMVGLWGGYHLMDTSLTMQVINVSFKPGGAYPFMRVPLSELHNQIVSLDVLWGRFAAEIRERLCAVPSVQARFALLECLLLARLQETPYGFDVVQSAVNEITRHHGALSIRALSDHLGISQKHLIAQFRRMVGATPKELARVYRFTQVLRSVDAAQPVDWTQVAHLSNYYDQSHFNKDFEAFAGHSPSDYLRLRRHLPAETSKPFKQLAVLPTG